jgi:hypothetical protein
MTDDFEEKIDESELAGLGITKTDDGAIVDDDAVVDDAVEPDPDAEEKETDTGMFGDDPEFENYMMTGEYTE